MWVLLIRDKGTGDLSAILGLQSRQAADAIIGWLEGFNRYDILLTFDNQGEAK